MVPNLLPQVPTHLLLTPLEAPPTSLGGDAAPPSPSRLNLAPAGTAFLPKAAAWLRE